MAAEVIATGGVRVTVFDRMPSLGRKFLLAGRGGLNITHSEDAAQFLGRYGAAEAKLAPAIASFGPTTLRAWCEGLGQTTFVGTSGRVFPQSMKTSPLLRAWLRRLAGDGVAVKLRHRFVGREDGALRFETPDGAVRIEADAVVLALGGASWPHLGSDGDWVAHLKAQGIGVETLRAANSGLLVAWSEIFKKRFAGTPLKRIALSYGTATVRGEAIVTASGIEGGAVYALGRYVRGALDAAEPFTIDIDLKPDQTLEDIAGKLAKPRAKRTLKEHLRRELNLGPAAIGLVQEVLASSAGGTPDAERLARLIKHLPIVVTGATPIARAISTAGGIRLDEIDDAYMLTKMPGVFVAGEMLDWEAPTGGYLLQACFSTGAAAGRGVLDWLSRGSRLRAAPRDRSPTEGETR
ncbi:MAG: TIGR03862 family flavoprotein [Hyphomicrobiales bacterium]|nr:MAG: TIGR03862 family flavoprotein [Hyphomicrobiales bacterium]